MLVKFDDGVALKQAARKVKVIKGKVMREKLMDSLKTAMKAGDKPRVSAVRMIQAELKDKDIEARGLGKVVTEEDILSLLQKMVKKRQESLSIYEKADREDLASVERGEIAIISEFLPVQMSEADAMAAIKAVISEINANGMKDMGKVVAVLKTKYAGTMDFGKASALVKAQLTAQS